MVASGLVAGISIGVTVIGVVATIAGAIGLPIFFRRQDERQRLIDQAARDIQTFEDDLNGKIDYMRSNNHVDVADTFKQRMIRAKSTYAQQLRASFGQPTNKEERLRQCGVYSHVLEEIRSDLEAQAQLLPQRGMEGAPTPAILRVPSDPTEDAEGDIPLKPFPSLSRDTLKIPPQTTRISNLLVRGSAGMVAERLTIQTRAAEEGIEPPEAAAVAPIPAVEELENTESENVAERASLPNSQMARSSDGDSAYYSMESGSTPK